MRATHMLLGMIALVALLAAAVYSVERLSTPTPRQTTADDPVPDARAPSMPNRESALRTPSNEVGITSESEILRITESLRQHSNDIGKYWMNVLDDERNTNLRRSHAARALGAIKYAPAKPLLIKHIRMIDTNLGYSDGMDDEHHVVKYALAQYGFAAVPEIVNAYLDSTDKGQRAFLLGAIAAGKTQKVARTYIHGLHAQRDKRVTDKDLTLDGPYFQYQELVPEQ